MQSAEMESEEPGFGVQLRQARELAGLSPAEMAARLNLVEDYILWLEQEQLDELPGHTFTRGYVRGYAKYLGLPPDQLVEQYNVQTGQQARPLKPLISRHQMRASDPLVRWSTFAIILLFLALSMIWWKSQQDALVVGGNTTVADAITVETAGGEVLVLDAGKSLSTLEMGSQTVEQSNQESSDAPLEVEKDLTDELFVDNSLDAQSAPGLLNNRLKLSFTDTSWVEVQDAKKKILFTGVKKSGDQLELASEYLFDIVIGNAAAVKLSYNSDPVDLEGFTNDQNVAKLTLGKD